MTAEQTLTSINIVLTAMTFIVGYFTYQFSRKKDFQDKLYNIKIEAYNEINEQCYAAIKRLDVNSTPFVEMYDFTNEEDWMVYYEQHVTPLVKVGFDIQKSVFKYTIFLPPDFCDRLEVFAKYCVRFAVEYAHFSSELNVESQDRLWDKYISLVKSIREDIKVEELDLSLRKRIIKKMW